MGFFNNLFGKKDQNSPIETTEQMSFQDFWNWFATKESEFFQVVKSRNNIETDFFDKLAPKVKSIDEGIYFLTGMKDDNTAELIFTPDGVIKKIALIEDLVSAAPSFPNWIFTALKPSSEDISNIGLRMGDYSFDKDNLWFYANSDTNYPDEVDIVLVYENYKPADKDMITNAAYIFLDNYLGELNSITTIDRLEIVGKNDAKEELIPIGKLKDYLLWREREFVEKYNAVSYDTTNDGFSSLEATLNNGLPLIAIVDKTLLEWDNKASHPWMVTVKIKYDGKNNNGFPNETMYKLLDEFEDEIAADLKDVDGYLNIGRETADNERVIFMACKDFRKPSRVLDAMMNKYKGKIDFTYSIFKDKYWKAVEMYNVN